MTYLQPRSASISALTSPVWAPFGDEWQSCPPSAIPLPARTPPTVSRRVAGGQTRTSQPISPPAEAVRATSARASAAPSARNPFIFQLPATSFVPIAMLRPRRPASIIRPLRSHRLSGGSTGPSRQEEASCLHAASDPLQSGILHRQGFVRTADPDLRHLGDRRHLPQPRDRHGGRDGRRPEHPRRGFADRAAPGAGPDEGAIRQLVRSRAGKETRFGGPNS